MKAFITSTLLFFTSFLSNGQKYFQRIYGGSEFDAANCIRQTNDSGYIILGLTKSFGAGEYDTYLLKTDKYGDTLWSRTYGTPTFERGRSIEQTFDSGYLFCSEGFNALTGIRLTKTKPNGDTLWTRTFQGRGYFTQTTSDSNIIVAGSFLYGNWNMHLLKLDNAGDTLWTKSYGTNNQVYCINAKETRDKGFVLVGNVGDASGGNNDILIVKTDSNGNVNWSKIYIGSRNDEATSIKQTYDGGYIISGTTYSNSKGIPDMLLMKIDTNGIVEWSNCFGGKGYSHGEDVLQTKDGGFLLAGYTQAFGDEAYLLKTNKSGSMIWSKTFGKDFGTEAFFSMEQTFDGSIVLVGITNNFGSFGGNSDLYVVKCDSIGEGTCYSGNPATVSSPISFGVKDTLLSVSALGKYATVSTTLSKGGQTKDICKSLKTFSTYLDSIGISIFPNPALHLCTLNFNNTNYDVESVQLINSLGSIVSEYENIKGASLIIEKRELSSGIYVCKIIDSKGAFRFIKLVFQ